MLEDLNIKNFALIDSVSIDFKKGFTVLSGETGAGKSILIGALSFLLGGKASTEQIRTGKSEADVSGTFLVSDNPAALSWLEQHSIEIESGRVLLRRTIKDSGKTAAWIEGSTVTRTDLAEFSSFLVDIHGQHEHQSLMHPVKHRIFLDSYAGILEEVDSFTSLYNLLIEKRNLLAKIDSSEKERLQRIDMLDFAVNEIDSAKLKADEEEKLREEEMRLSSYEKLYSDLEGLNSLLAGQEGDVLSNLKKIRNFSSRLSGLDKNLSALDSRVESAFYELSDISQEYQNYFSELVFDPQRLDEVSERLNLILKLKKKYLNPNASVQDLLNYADESRNELEQLANGTKNKEKLNAEIDEIEAKVYQAALNLSKKRHNAADKMSCAVEQVLFKLGMKSTKFSVGLTSKEDTDIAQKCGPYGMDNVEFLISANPGSPMLPLAKIASGGELSRVMLALKTVLSDNDPVGTLVFDEIDTGIGGEVAVAVGSHIKNLSSSKQILCITHLASIAVYADNQIKIQKSSQGSGDSASTSTVVFAIEGEDRIQEIARMLSGDVSDSQSREYAKSMLLKFGGIHG